MSEPLREIQLNAASKRRASRSPPPEHRSKVVKTTENDPPHVARSNTRRHLGDPHVPKVAAAGASKSDRIDERLDDGEPATPRRVPERSGMRRSTIIQTESVGRHTPRLTGVVPQWRQSNHGSPAVGVAREEHPDLFDALFEMPGPSPEMRRSSTLSMIRTPVRPLARLSSHRSSSASNGSVPRTPGVAPTARMTPASDNPFNPSTPSHVWGAPRSSPNPSLSFDPRYSLSLNPSNARLMTNDILPSTTALKRSRSLSRSAHYPVPTGGSVNSLFGSIRAGDASGVRLSKRVKQEVEHEETDIEDDEESGSESEGEGEDGTGQSEKEEPSGGASGDEFEDDYGVGSPSDSSIEGQDAVAAAGDSLGSSPEQNAGADEEKLATLDNEGGEQDGKEHVAHADDGEYGESGDLEESLVGQDAAEESRFAFEDDVSVSGSNVISSSLYSVQLSAVPHPTALPVPPKDDKDTVPITAEAERPGQHIKEIDVQSSPQENNSQEQTLTNISTPSLPSLHQFPPASPPLPHLPSPASPASQASPASPSSSPPPPPSSPPFLPALGSPHHEEASTDHEHLQQSSSQSAPQAAEEFSEPTEEEDATILQPPSSSSSSWAGSGSDGSVVDDLQLQPDVSADGTNTVSETGSANATANGTLTNPTTTTSPPPSSPITLTGPAQSMWFDLPAQQAHFSYLEDEACFLAELEEPLGGINGAVPNGVMMIPGGANETPPLTNPPPTPANPVVGLPELAHLAVEDVDWEAVANVDSFPESDDFMVEEGDFMSEDFEWEDEEELEELEAAGEDGEVEVEV